MLLAGQQNKGPTGLVCSLAKDNVGGQHGERKALCGAPNSVTLQCKPRL